VVIRQFGPMFPGVRCQVRSTAVEGSSACRCFRSCLHSMLAPCLAAQHFSITSAACPSSITLQVGLALQATSLTVANERKAAVEVTPEAAALFGQYWQAHGSCPLRGRNKVGGA